MRSSSVISFSKRVFDLAFIILFSPFIIGIVGVISLVIFLVDGRPIFYESYRIGACKTTFKMYKFRTMILNTPEVESNNLENPMCFITRSGVLLRKFSLDELPQFFNVILGEMSLVGPRPALPNQHQLLRYRSDLGVDLFLPGITGLAQINGRDDLPNKDKAHFDSVYCHQNSILIDLAIIIRTIFKTLAKKNISH